MTALQRKPRDGRVSCIPDTNIPAKAGALADGRVTSLDSRFAGMTIRREWVAWRQPAERNANPESLSRR